MNQRVLDSLPVERETTIREMFQNHPKRRLRERALMIILSSQGLCVKQIADILKLRVCPEIKFIIHDLSRRLAEWCNSIHRAMHLVPD
jgi:hypothetical protein